MVRCCWHLRRQYRRVGDDRVATKIHATCVDFYVSNADAADQGPTAKQTNRLIDAPALPRHGARRRTVRDFVVYSKEVVDGAPSRTKTWYGRPLRQLEHLFPHGAQGAEKVNCNPRHHLRSRRRPRCRFAPGSGMIDAVSGLPAETVGTKPEGPRRFCRLAMQMNANERGSNVAFCATAFVRGSNLVTAKAVMRGPGGADDPNYDCAARNPPTPRSIAVTCFGRNPVGSVSPQECAMISTSSRTCFA